MTNGKQKAPIKKANEFLSELESVLSTGETILTTATELTGRAISAYGTHRRLLTAFVSDLGATIAAARAHQKALSQTDSTDGQPSQLDLFERDDLVDGAADVVEAFLRARKRSKLSPREVGILKRLLRS